MRFFLHFILIFLSPIAILQAQKDRCIRIEVTNITAFQQLDEQITIKRKELEASVGKISDSVIPLIRDSQLTSIPSQVDDLDQDHKWDELVFVYHMMPRQRAIFTIAFVDKANAPVFKSCTSMDFYRVSQELGAGSLAIMERDALIRLGVKRKNATDHIDSILINKGPVRALFRLDYYGRDNKGEKYRVHRLVSVWAGRHGYENRLWMEGDSTDRNLIVGLADNKDRNSWIVKKYVPGLTALITQDQQLYKKKYFTGLALLFPSDKYVGVLDSDRNTCSAKLKMPVNNPLTFYVYPGWEPEDAGNRNADDFVKMITHEAAMINMPAKVRILENGSCVK